MLSESIAALIEGTSTRRAVAYVAAVCTLVSIYLLHRGLDAVVVVDRPLGRLKYPARAVFQQQPLPVPRPSIDARDKFVLDNVVDEPHDSTWNETLAAMIANYNAAGGCPSINNELGRIHLQEGLRAWSQMASAAEIPWVFFFGTLVAYARGEQLVPWDTDVDVLIPTWAYSKLRAFSMPLPLPPNEKSVLFVHPEYGWVRGDERRRFTCDGRITPRHSTRCSFIAPMGRLFTPYGFVDIFGADFVVNQTETGLKEWLVVDGGTEVEIFHADSVFPVRPCTCLEVRGWCPYDYKAVLLQKYGPHVRDLRPLRLCDPKLKRLVSRAENQGLFAEDDAAWDAAWGDQVGHGDVARLGVKRALMPIADYCNSSRFFQFQTVYSLCKPKVFRGAKA